MQPTVSLAPRLARAAASALLLLLPSCAPLPAAPCPRVACERRVVVPLRATSVLAKGTYHVRVLLDGAPIECVVSLPLTAPARCTSKQVTLLVRSEHGSEPDTLQLTVLHATEELVLDVRRDDTLVQQVGLRPWGDAGRGPGRCRTACGERIIHAIPVR